MHRLKLWFFATRPKTLLASLSPLILGISLSLGHAPLNKLTLSLIITGAICIQIGTNFANDYYDFKQGADTETRKGPTRAVQAGWIQPSTMKTAMIMTFCMAALCSLYLIYIGGIPILLIATSSIISGILYTAGPYSLAYLGIADIFAFAFFGPIAVGGTVYLLTGSVTLTSLLLGFIPGCFSMGLLSINNLRDCNEDKLAGKKTLAVRFGSKFVKAEYVSCHLLIYFTVLISYVNNLTSPHIIWVLLGVPLSLVLIKDVFIKIGISLNQTLGQTAGLMFVFTLFVSILV
jgi:1,4-dihydroxy-2-naphthoate polyprenyltransferase